METSKISNGKTVRTYYLGLFLFVVSEIVSWPCFFLWLRGDGKDQSLFFLWNYALGVADFSFWVIVFGIVLNKILSFMRKGDG
jgi:hypothetical protein